MLIDLHVHTYPYSACSEMSPDDMMEAAKAIGLDGVCLTEHGKVWSPEEARALSEEHGLPVFRGVEVTTTGGDVIVFGIEEAPEGMPTAGELKKMVDAAGGVAIAAHPFRGFLVFGFGALSMDMSTAKANPTFAHVHGLEVCNGNVTDEENDLARRVAEEMDLLMLGGSDAHTTKKVGRCATRFRDRIENERQLIEAILGNRHAVQNLGWRGP